ARAAFEGLPLRLRYPQAIRPWQHVLDALRGYLMLAEAARSGVRVDEAWNLGPPETEALAVGEVVNAFMLATGKSMPFELIEGDGKPEAAVLRLNTMKARERLGWQTTLPIDRAVNMTALWYRGFYEGESAREMTARQIDAVFGAATSLS
ncbi:MAG TPA: hypothetical protein VNF68_12660, partial [Candidatus Baltobacteraceae bacterium]|nr:hypothetical protein [Candidatus Baltobacteraceae bacterium]